MPNKLKQRRLHFRFVGGSFRVGSLRHTCEGCCAKHKKRRSREGWHDVESVWLTAYMCGGPPCDTSIPTITISTSRAIGLIDGSISTMDYLHPQKLHVKRAGKTPFIVQDTYRLAQAVLACSVTNISPLHRQTAFDVSIYSQVEMTSHSKEVW